MTNNTANYEIKYASKIYPSFNGYNKLQEILRNHGHNI
jgi:hypothetical protein